MNRPLRAARDLLRRLVATLGANGSWPPTPYLVEELVYDAEAILPLLEPRRPAPRKALPGKSRAAKKRETKEQRAERLTKIRQEAWARSGGRCESTERGLRCTAIATELDHWLSGNGRRRQQESLSTVWFLCATHHIMRTRNVPGADVWNMVFREHCLAYGYSFTPHITRAAAHPPKRTTER